uniref:Uncharacterized protein n=2 Tax=Phlebotomus papatasi TaxID=29031 RepID=A0A1B0GNY9_PHLPP
MMRRNSALDRSQRQSTSSGGLPSPPVVEVGGSIGFKIVSSTLLPQVVIPKLPPKPKPPNS